MKTVRRYALKELINIVCGQFLKSTFGEELAFDLPPPSISEIGKEGCIKPV